ncbi:MAG TPA: histidine kinase [Longimicrobiales bacterium]|nr:histidine kinase [Longimicrobiales bacterium]
MSLEPPDGPTRLAARPSGPLHGILGLPLFYKLLIANALIVFAAAVGTALPVAWAGENGTPWRLIIVVSLAAVAVSMVVNGLVVRVALTPLSRLEDTARQVQHGNHDARAPTSVIADRDLAQLVDTFNQRLDSLGVYRGRLREVAVRALEAGEAERKRISRELHDGIAQTLAALLLQLRLARDVSDPEVREDLLAETADQLAAAIDELRAIAHGLRPPALDMLGLVAAVESHARVVSEATGLRVEVQASRIDGLLSPEVELALYRLLQEALSNVTKHADAEAATVRIEPGTGTVVATVTDNGRGFVMEDALARPGLGLFGMHERAAYAGGRVRITSEPGHGTTVRIEFPVRETASYA